MRNLLTQVEQSELKVKYAVVTDRRTGEGGKHHSLRALTSGALLICDDNAEIIREFLGKWISWLSDQEAWLKQICSCGRFQMVIAEGRRCTVGCKRFQSSFQPWILAGCAAGKHCRRKPIPIITTDQSSSLNLRADRCQRSHSSGSRWVTIVEWLMMRATFQNQLLSVSNLHAVT